MTLKTKICGITTVDDYLTCCEAGATWVGLVHYPGSARHLDLRALARLASVDVAETQAAPGRVLLSVNMLDEPLAPLVAAANPNILQLHGEESPEDVSIIKARFGLPIIKAIAIETLNDLDHCAKWDGLADWLLFDAKAKNELQPGGTGLSFDWSILKSYKGRLPWILAGGLNSINVSSAIEISGAQAVDVSSGVELKPGKKDAEQIRAFIQRVKLV